MSTHLETSKPVRFVSLKLCPTPAYTRLMARKNDSVIPNYSVGLLLLSNKPESVTSHCYHSDENWHQYTTGRDATELHSFMPPCSFHNKLDGQIYHLNLPLSAQRHVEDCAIKQRTLVRKLAKKPALLSKKVLSYP